MKIIGIRGHRGAGKSTIAYLLAQTIEYFTKYKKPEDIDSSEYKGKFDSWCEAIVAAPDEAGETALNYMDCRHVIIEGFGDGPKMMLSMLTGIEMRDMNSDYMKDHMVINMKDFSYSVCEDTSKINLYTADDYYLYVSGEPAKVVEYDTYLTLRELIVFFGLHVMQGSFGANVWVKSLVANKRFYDGLFGDENTYKIFADVKSRTESSYIRDNGGVIIRVERPSHKKKGGLDLLKGDSRYDYTVTINGQLENLSTIIHDIAKDIVFNYTNIERK